MHGLIRIGGLRLGRQPRGIRYSVIDQETGAFIVSDLPVTPWGFCPTVFAVGEYIIVGYLDVNAVKYRAINVSAPRTLQNEVVFNQYADVGPDGDGNAGCWDVAISSNGNAYLSWWDNNNGISISTLAPDLSQGSVIAFDQNQDLFGSWFDNSGNLWFGFLLGSGVYAAAFTSSLSPLVSTTLLESNIPNIFAICGIETSPGIQTVYYEVDSGGETQNNVIRECTISTIGTPGVPSDFARSVSLWSKPFSANGTTYLGTSYSSTLQSTLFLLDQTGRAVSKAAPQVAGRRTNHLVASVSSPRENVFLSAGSRKSRLYSEDVQTDGYNNSVINKSPLFTLLGVQGFTLDFADPNQFQSIELGEELHIVGGIVSVYDGVRITEANFNLYPDSDFMSATTFEIAGDPVLSNGQYQYLVTYEDTDNNGRIIRSTTSEPTTVTIQSTTTTTGDSSDPIIVTQNYSVSLSGPMLRITSRPNVRVCVYRTEANGTVFYRATSIVSPIFNDPTIDTWTFVDTVPDSELIVRERVYTDGGVLDASPPPFATLITTYRNRVWLAGLEDGNTLWYSNTLVQGEVPNFSPLLTSIADQRGGKIGALGSLDDGVIVFKETAIFQISGDGPDNTGAGNVFNDPQHVTSDVGCSNPNSVAEVPLGLVFQSQKGIMLLGRDYSIQYIGSPVEKYNSLTITSTTVIADQNIVVFTTGEGTALVWDYFYNQWGTFTNHQAADSIIWDETFILLRPTGKVLSQNKSSFSDAGEKIKPLLQTAWIQIAGMMGAQRIRRAAVLGEFKGAHTLQIGVSFDFSTNPTGSEVYQIDATSVIQSDFWGSGASWGSDATWGGQYQPYYFVLPVLVRQVCQAVSFIISEDDEVSPNEAFSLSGLTLEIGVRPGFSIPNDNQKAFS